jgi:hypothetical protein
MLSAMRKYLLASALAYAFAIAPAAAQQQPSPPSNPECVPGSGTTAKPGKPLGERLAQSKGVICPPDVDPAMKVPPPETGSKMPVIPPSGTPGGDRKIELK